MIRILFALSLALIGVLPAFAATPATFAAEIKAAQPGQTITLEPGDYGLLGMYRRAFDPPLVIKGGSFTEVRLTEVSGVTIEGAKVAAASLPYSYSKLVTVAKSSKVTLLNFSVTGPNDGKGGGFYVVNSSDFEIRAARIRYLLRGIVVDRGSNGIVAHNDISRMWGDGINVADSRDIAVTRNIITDFTPLVHADGSIFHPDGIQLWSVAGHVPQANIAIRDNIVICQCQGITQFDHAQGGSDGVIVQGNVVGSGFPHGIALYEARGATVADNIIRTLPGSRWQSRLNIVGGSVTSINNSVGPK